MHRLVPRILPGSLPGVPDALVPLLLNRGVNTPEAAQAFLHPDESGLCDPRLLANMDAACALVRDAISAGQPITVYGDYDCDGVCASAIQEEGYGLNEAAVRRLAENTRLLITVDCGITAVPEVALAKDLGMSVLLTDHHTLCDPLPGADAILHPQLGNYPCPNLCGAGVAYKLSCALLGQQVLPTLELCALATIADMVPLLGENRVLAALGLQRMSLTARPGLRALLSVAGIAAGTAITGMQAAFQLAPRINACGRMETANIALDLLTAADPLRAVELAERADGLNARRKSIEQRLLEEADAQVQGMDLCEKRAIIVMGEGWESGVVGLVAGRLAERYGYPTVALSRDGDTCVGSARSACGVDLYQALADCQDLFLRFGGHKQAAGLTIGTEKVPAFRERLSDAVARQLSGRTLMPETAYDAEITLPQITLSLIEEVKRLEPFGMGNPAPVYLLRDADVLSARAVGSEGAHLKLALSQEGAVMDAIAFGQGALAGTLHGLCSLAVTPVANTFGGKTSAECRVEAVGEAGSRFAAAPADESRALLQEFDRLCRIDESAPPDAIADVPPPPTGDQGTLYLCRTAETANRLCTAYPHLSVLQGDGVEPRAYTALWYCSAAAPRGPYRRVILCDGALCGRETALLHALYPHAEVIALPQSAALQGRIAALRFSVDELRALYVNLRRGERISLDDPRCAAMARVLQSLNLLSPELRLLPPSKCDPASDPLYQIIQGCEP